MDSVYRGNGLSPDIGTMEDRDLEYGDLDEIIGVAESWVVDEDVSLSSAREDLSEKRNASLDDEGPVEGLQGVLCQEGCLA